jgi:hypothetical protein
MDFCKLSEASCFEDISFTFLARIRPIVALKFLKFLSLQSSRYSARVLFLPPLLNFRQKVLKYINEDLTKEDTVTRVHMDVPVYMSVYRGQTLIFYIFVNFSSLNTKHTV